MRAARIIVDAVEGGRPPLRLPLGAEAVRRLTDAYRAGLDGVAASAGLARAADFPDAVATPRPV